MTKMTQERMEADWLATRNIAGLQEQLDAETDDGKSSILTQLLAAEFAKLKTPQSIGPERVTADAGKRAKGIVFCVLLVTATTGGVFLWENHQGGTDVRAVMAESR